jgi:hypothetical protein
MKPTTTNDFAMLLDGREYTEEITKEEELIAKSNNFVVCFGASDDLLEFRGAIHDEFGACDGTDVHIFNNKPIDLVELESDKKVLNKYGIDLNLDLSIVVKAEWSPQTLNASWLITVKGVESDSFDIMEDGQIYCRGVVFALPQKGG